MGAPGRSDVAKRAGASLDPLDQFELRLGHRFNDRKLLERAITHRSASADHNERLEYLGDSVLSLVISERLYGAMQALP